MSSYTTCFNLSSDVEIQTNYIYHWLPPLTEQHHCEPHATTARVPSSPDSDSSREANETEVIGKTELFVQLLEKISVFCQMFLAENFLTSVFQPILKLPHKKPLSELFY